MSCKETDGILAPGKFCARYNVIGVAYGPYQLPDLATRLGREVLGWFIEFPQGTQRLTADKTIYDLIRDRWISHDGNPDLRQHAANAIVWFAVAIEWAREAVQAVIDNPGHLLARIAHG